MVALALDRQQRRDARIATGLRVGLATVTVVGDECLHLAQHLGQCLDGLDRGLDFTLVVAGLAYMRGEHQHRLRVHAGLRVVALLETPTRDRHDARLFVRQVDLIAEQAQCLVCAGKSCGTADVSRASDPSR